MPLIDSADLLDANEVATILGLSHREAVAVYRHRHPDFPTPAVEKGSGKCVLWNRSDIEAWRVKHPARVSKVVAEPGRP